MPTDRPAPAFAALIPEYLEETAPLPTCPDGSGDLWWDNASYIRYQVGPPEPYYSPEHIQFEVFTPNYCPGPDTDAPF